MIRTQLLISLVVVCFAEVRFPDKFPADVRTSIEALVPAGVQIELDVSSSQKSPEAFVVSCLVSDSSRVTRVSASDRRGVLFGFYALLRRAGYGFLHPTHVIVPKSPGSWCLNFEDAPAKYGRHGTPLLSSVRGSHYHTQHPLEMTNVLNGFASDGSYDSDAAWAEGLPLWTSYLQWLVANGQNFVEWCLLEAEPWQDFATSDARHSRLKRVVKMAHDWGVRVSIDAPLNLAQQHAWRLQPSPSDDVNVRLDWLLETGVDAVSTEMGTTEFSSTSPNHTLTLINAVVQHLADKGKELIVKNHASTSQHAKGIADPLQPDRDINFNFLTYYADERVVNAPHTIQMYSLHDPLMGSYGRHNYTDVKAMMKLQQKRKKPTVFFPETAYWVDFDSSVPLFLPIYAANRLADLKILKEEMPDAGHLNFESGWPLGYWFSNTAQAVAAWTCGQGFNFTSLTAHVLAPLPEANELISIVTTLTAVQNQSLVYDIFDGQDGQSQTLMAYLQGYEGMNEAQDIWNFAVVQPRRTHPREVQLPWFSKTLQPRLLQLANDTLPLSLRCKSLRTRLRDGGPADELTKDMCIGVEVFHLRVKQVTGVYSAAAARNAYKKADMAAGLEHSRKALIAASALIGELQLDESTTRWSGVATPTSYPFGYLWSAANLFFWRRDHQIVQHGISQPCYLNLYDPIEVGLAKGGHAYWKTAAYYVHLPTYFLPWLNRWSGCMSGPITKPPKLDPLVGEIVLLA